MALRSRLLHLLHLPTAVFLIAVFPLLAQADSKPMSLSMTVPAGEWKTLRLKNLPKDVMVVLAITSTGPINIGFIDESDNRQFPNIQHPLFWGQFDVKLGFSVTIQQNGDHYLLLDNRSGSSSRQIKATVKATLGQEAAKALWAAQIRKVELQLKALEQKLNQAFIFEPIGIRVSPCNDQLPFHRATTLTLCLEYARDLMTVFQDKTQASDALVYSMFYEMAHVFQQQWGLDLEDAATSLDELTTVLLLTFRQDAAVRAYSQTMINQPTLSITLNGIIHDAAHPLTAERAQRVLKWATDPDLVHKWQPRLVPHMQTRMLQQLKDHPQPWSDRQLIDTALAERSRNPLHNLPTVQPKGRIKA